MKSIPIGYILYNPSEKSIKRINSTAEEGYQVYLVINSNVETSFLDILKANKSIQILNFGENIGLSRGLKILTEKALLDGHKALLYFDQDTDYTSATLQYISTYFCFVRESTPDIYSTIACTTFRDTRSICKKYNYISTVKLGEYSLEKVFFTINSGSLYFLENTSVHSLFDEKFFIDGVDYVFCINAIKQKFDVTEIYSTPGLDHESEQGNLSFGKLNGRIYSYSRIIDFLNSHIKILLYTFKIRSLKPKMFILKATISYLYCQLFFRLFKKRLLTKTN